MGLRDGSCDGRHHPSDHDVGGSSETWERFGCADFAEANDLPARTPEFVLRNSHASAGGMNAGWVEPSGATTLEPFDRSKPRAADLRAIPGVLTLSQRHPSAVLVPHEAAMIKCTHFPLDSRNENLPEKRIHRNYASRPGGMPRRVFCCARASRGRARRIFARDGKET